MNREYCAVCGATAEQKHHISYEPPMEIPICVSCHKKVHIKHGVGPVTGHYRSRRNLNQIMSDLIIAERAAHNLAAMINRRRVFTRETVNGFSRPIVDAESGLVLLDLTCGCSRFATGWKLYATPETRSLYLTCDNCGCDWLLTQFQNWRPSDLISIAEKVTE